MAFFLCLSVIVSVNTTVSFNSLIKAQMRKSKADQTEEGIWIILYNISKNNCLTCLKVTSKAAPNTGLHKFLVSDSIYVK